MLVIDPFSLLLNNISNELDERNLRSLIHVCGNYIPGAQRETIRHGWDVFSILRHQNIISNELEKIINLLRIIKVLRPKRRDLVNLVKQYIRDRFPEVDDITAAELESSSSDVLQLEPENGENVPVLVFPAQCCSFDCCCCKCSCYSRRIRPCWCLVFVALLVFAIVAVSVLWYGDITGVNNQISNIAQAGKYIIGLLVSLALCCFCCFVYLNCFQREIRGYGSLPPGGYNSFSVPRWDCASTVSTASSAVLTRQASQKTGYGRNSVGGTPNTASSSLASLNSTRGALTRMDPRVIADGAWDEESTEYFSPGHDGDDADAQSRDSALVMPSLMGE